MEAVKEGRMVLMICLVLPRDKGDVMKTARECKMLRRLPRLKGQRHSAERASQMPYYFYHKSSSCSDTPKGAHSAEIDITP